VGPELPLSLGVVDALQERGFRVFGPTREAALLETSKGFAKRFLQRHQIPTARYAVCSSPSELGPALDMFHPPIVVKADGLAAGKGVILCQSRRTALEAAEGLFTGTLLGEQERQIVIEEFLEGEEVSFLCLSDGKHVAPLVPAQDHKRIGEGDTGPNTGGMGVYTGDDLLDPHMGEWILHHIAEPTVRGMADEETPYVGVLYCGLMMTARGPQVLEFNARFGDPETQAILPRLRSDLLGLMEATIAPGGLDRARLEWAPEPAVTVVLASRGYPASSSSGDVITGLGEVPADVFVTHAGTARSRSGQLVTAGGRVLGVTGLGRDAAAAREAAYAAANVIKFDGKQFRGDIALRLVDSERSRA
jgi:phosphoribosylamine--glycine ligase